MSEYREIKPVDHYGRIKKNIESHHFDDSTKKYLLDSLEVLSETYEGQKLVTNMKKAMMQVFAEPYVKYFLSLN